MRQWKLLSALTALCILALGAGTILAPSPAAGQPDATTIGARIIEIEGAAEALTPGRAARPLSAGDDVYFGEEFTLRDGSRATLAMADKTLREFEGPTTLTIHQDAAPGGGSVLGNLSAALASMLFSGKQRTSDAVMTTRSADAGAESKTSVPCLIHPAPGENLAAAPKLFKWKAVEGVPLYRVSVYSMSQMMWQTTTAERSASCPVKMCDFRPGENYYWVVEALVGNTALRSQAANFAVSSAELRSALEKGLSDAEVAMPDTRSAVALEVRLCLDSGAYSTALELLDRSIAASPTRAAYALRAEVDSRIGLTEEAVGDYRQAITIPPSY